ncbi:cytochrome d8-PA [Histoplasma capsulatum G186AR]|uniref:Cytochrome d8-PA n=2 Tax=Ajellomyces capsulatus TaxID=5037 RepID=C0NIN8_AJECG|nr:cytochrome d8-PA [Histoplasma capsulatum G186AR]EEH08758.1 cytochrome d8-PA [Histoplasma capsulatum G186AR]
MSVSLFQTASPLFVICAASVPLLVFFLYSRLKYYRFHQFSHFPQAPPDLFFGHLKIVNETIAEEPGRHHALFDLRPIQYPLILIGSHEIAEQISKASAVFKYSVPKSPTAGMLIPVVGKKSIILTNDETWKHGRKKFNAAFASSNLVTFLPKILDKTMEFLALLDGYVESGEEFCLAEPCVQVTFDIIGLAVLNIDFKSMQGQDKVSVIVRTFRSLLSTFPTTFAFDSWFTNPKGHYRRIALVKTLTASLTPIVKEKFDMAHNNIRLDNKVVDRSVMAMGLRQVHTLTPQVLEECVDAVKSFLFAGHDTTAVVLQWSIYELSRTPRALAAMRKELDEVFGPDADPKSVANQLLEDSNKLQNLQYTSAVIKESLRLYPPAGSARMVAPGSDFRLNTKDGPLDVGGMILYVCHYAVHRDPTVYGETADVWIPERWLGQTSTTSEDNAPSSVDKDKNSSTAGAEGQKIPISAWRAFERGPRNCIGQELANLEARAILAMVVRRYEFTKVGIGSLALKDGKPVLDQHGQFEVTKPLFGTFNVTMKPVDGTLMTIKYA